MRPYGERDKFKYNYVDNTSWTHCPNWWEFELEYGDNKGRARQKAKIEISKSINELYKSKAP